MLQMIIGIACILAVIFIRDEPNTSYKIQKPKYDPWVILALEELDEEMD